MAKFLFENRELLNFIILSPLPLLNLSPFDIEQKTGERSVERAFKTKVKFNESLTPQELDGPWEKGPSIHLVRKQNSPKN